MQAWFVAKTKPAKEKSVKTYVEQRWGINVFLPFIKRPVNKKKAWEPLFPTYMFCQIDIRSEVWPDIRWVPGLCYFLSTGQEIVPVSDALINHIKHRVSQWNDGGFLPHFEQDDLISVSEGPFSGLEGIFKRYIPARQRCEVFLYVVGKLSKVELPVQSLVKQSPYQKLALAT